MDTQAADREEVTKDLEEGNCELASDLDWSADEEDLAVAQAEPGEPDLDEPMREALGEGSVARSAPGARTEGETEGVRLDQPTVISLQTGDSDGEEATPDWGPTLNLRASPALGPHLRPAGNYPLRPGGHTCCAQGGPRGRTHYTTPKRGSEGRSAARATTPQRERARASSEPPPQAEEELAVGSKASSGPPSCYCWHRWLKQTRRSSASGNSPRAEGLAASRQGLEEAAHQERARVAQAAEEEERYRAGLNPELQRLERANPVGPRQGEPILTNNRLQADIEAGVPVWVARRRHRARERAAKHQAEQAKVGAPPLNSAGSEQRNPGEGGKGLDEDLDAAAKRELREFRRTLLQQEGGARSLSGDSQSRRPARSGGGRSARPKLGLFLGRSGNGVPPFLELTLSLPCRSFWRTSDRLLLSPRERFYFAAWGPF